MAGHDTKHDVQLDAVARPLCSSSGTGGRYCGSAPRGIALAALVAVCMVGETDSLLQSVVWRGGYGAFVGGGTSLTSFGGNALAQDHKLPGGAMNGGAAVKARVNGAAACICGGSSQMSSADEFVCVRAWAGMKPRHLTPVNLVIAVQC